jgi:putative transcriptional regulator
LNGGDILKKTKHDWKEADALTDEEIRASELADPDAQPLTPERLAKMHRVPRTKSLRRALGLSQEEFATRYHIPVSTLRDWEQGRFEPDAAARAYLTVIAREPEICSPCPGRQAMNFEVSVRSHFQPQWGLRLRLIRAACRPTQPALTHAAPH